MPPPPAPLPIEALPAWASICGVSFNNVRLDRIPGKGVGLAASRRLSLAAGHEGANDDEALLKVPRDLVLSIDAVAQYAQLDTNFAGLLAAAGQPTARSHIALFLLAHLASSRAKDKAKKLVPTSWTNYIEFLPRDILVPTLWTEQERSLLDGTSLQVRWSIPTTVCVCTGTNVCRALCMPKWHR